MTAQAAIDEWIHQFPALQQVDFEIKFFRPMLTKIGYKLVGDVRWGVKARVAVGAASSMTGKYSIAPQYLLPANITTFLTYYTLSSS